MVLLGKKPLTLILSCICYVALNCYANVSSDSDEVRLKEALLLVDILKKEYIKVLRENVAGIYREDNNNTIFEDQSTCAPTTIEEKYNLSRSSDKLYGQAISLQVPELQSSSGKEHYARQWSSLPPPAPPPSPLGPTFIAPLAPLQARSSEKLHQRAISQQISPQPPPPPNPPDPLLLAPLPQGLYSSAVQYRMTPSPDFPLYGENLQRPYQSFRRRMPRDYYYYYERPWINNFPLNSRRKNADGEKKLRSNYEYPINAHPYNKVTKTTAVSTTITTTAPSRTTENTSNAALIFESKQSKINLITPSNIPKTYTENKNKLKFKAYFPNKSYRKMMAPDPVRDQVAAELASEIENADEPKSIDKPNRHNRITAIRIPTRLTTAKKHLGYYKKDDSPLDFVKATIRIHLERSTRYPIPFPENHAFCFTNPKSALCRTQI